MKIRSEVTRIPAADAHEAATHFAEKMRFETDCWDVHYTLEHSAQDFVLLDVRSQELFAQGHVPGALNLPQGRINEKSVKAWDPETMFVVYCAGPHCNGADKAALRLARLGRPVKLMIGGVEGWKDEGFELEVVSEDAEFEPLQQVGST